MIGGYDVGKKGNPSHCSIFAITQPEVAEETLVQIHQKFLDGWDYIKQIEYIHSCIEYFGISKMYYDATRSELDERGLPRRQCIPVILSAHDGPRAKSKMKMAVNLAKLVEMKRIRLLDDDRFISQITSVTNDLQAPNTPMGHGDSFISVMLAVAVYYDYFAKDRKLGFSYLGNLQESLSGNRTGDIDITKMDMDKPMQLNVIKRDEISCKICRGKNFEDIGNGQKRCVVCSTIW